MKSWHENLNIEKDFLYEEEHIGRVKDPRPKWTVIVGNGTRTGSTIVYYYNRDQRFVGWSYAKDDVKFDPFPTPADMSILSPDKRTIIKVSVNHGHDVVGKVVAFSDCAGGNATVPCMTVIRRLHGRPEYRAYLVHRWNENDRSYFSGHYNLSFPEALKLFAEFTKYEMKQAKDLGLPPIRIKFVSHWGTETDDERNNLRRW